MPKFLMVVQTSARAGRDDEFNQWYDNEHIEHMLSVPGVLSAKRYDLTDNSPYKPSNPYLTLYELEADDPTQVLAELGKRKFPVSDALETETTQMSFYKIH